MVWNSFLIIGCYKVKDCESEKQKRHINSHFNKLNNRLISSILCPFHIICPWPNYWHNPLGFLLHPVTVSVFISALNLPLIIWFSYTCCLAMVYMSPRGTHPGCPYSRHTWCSPSTAPACSCQSSASPTSPAHPASPALSCTQTTLLPLLWYLAWNSSF